LSSLHLQGQIASDFIRENRSDAMKAVREKPAEQFTVAATSAREESAMQSKNFVWISVFAVLLSTVSAFALDRDQNRRERSDRDYEDRWRNDRGAPGWDSEREWREYLKERKKAYKEWRKANREEQREFEKYLREKERYARALDRERDREWREYLREQRRECREWAKASRWEQEAFERYRRDRRGRPAGYYWSWDDGNLPRSGVCFYTDSNYRGDSYCLDARDSQRYVGKRYNDKISSIRLFGSIRNVIVYEHEDFNGSRRILAEDMPHLGKFNDKISSIEVR
jgi:hypothetical protein